MTATPLTREAVERHLEEHDDERLSHHRDFVLSLFAALTEAQRERDEARAQAESDYVAIADEMRWAREFGQKLPEPSRAVVAIIHARATAVRERDAAQQLAQANDEAAESALAQRDLLMAANDALAARVAVLRDIVGRTRGVLRVATMVHEDEQDERRDVLMRMDAALATPDVAIAERDQRREADARLDERSHVLNGAIAHLRGHSEMMFDDWRTALAEYGERVKAEARREALETMRSAVADVVTGEGGRLTRATLVDIASHAFAMARDALAQHPTKAGAAVGGEEAAKR